MDLRIIVFILKYLRRTDRKIYILRLLRFRKHICRRTEEGDKGRKSSSLSADLLNQAKILFKVRQFIKSKTYYVFVYLKVEKGEFVCTMSEAYH